MNESMTQTLGFDWIDFNSVDRIHNKLRKQVRRAEDFDKF